MSQRMVISGKQTGQLVGSTLVKRGRQVVLFKAYDGFALARHLISNPRVKKVRLEYGRKVYKTTREVWLKHAIPYHRPPYEPQLILPRSKFEVVDFNQMELL